MIADTSGNANNGSCPAGFPVLGARGKVGTAALFDGGSAIQVPNSAALNPAGTISVSVWMKPGSSADVFPTLVYKGDDNNNASYVLNYDNGATHLRFMIGDDLGALDIVTVAAPSLSVWHHVVGVADASTSRFTSTEFSPVKFPARL